MASESYKSLQPSQEVLFLSPTENEYIPCAIIHKAITLYSYYLKAQRQMLSQDKRAYHAHPSQLCPACSQILSKTSKPSHIPKSNPNLNTIHQPKKSKPIPKPSSLHHSHIPKPLHSSQPIPQLRADPTYPPCVQQLLQHLTSLNSPSHFNCINMSLKAKVANHLQ